MKRIRKIIENPLCLNPVSFWLRAFFSSMIAIIKNPTLVICGSALIRDSSFGKYVKIHNNCSVLSSYVGDMTYLGADSILVATKVGRYCSISGGVVCGLGLHPTHPNVSTHPAFYSIMGQSPKIFSDKNYFDEVKDTNVGNDVWIGGNVLILGGVSIGDGAVIGAGSVVTKNIEPYSITAGVPAKHIRYRFSDEQIKFLLNFSWWNKELDWIQRNWTLFFDIEGFIKKYSSKNS